MKQAGAEQPTFMSTHPGTADRIAALQKLMPEAKAAYKPS